MKAKQMTNFAKLTITTLIAFQLAVAPVAAQPKSDDYENKGLVQTISSFFFGVEEELQTPSEEEQKAAAKNYFERIVDSAQQTASNAKESVKETLEDTGVKLVVKTGDNQYQFGGVGDDSFCTREDAERAKIIATAIGAGLAFLTASLTEVTVAGGVAAGYTGIAWGLLSYSVPLFLTFILPIMVVGTVVYGFLVYYPSLLATCYATKYITQQV